MGVVVRVRTCWAVAALLGTLNLANAGGTPQWRVTEIGEVESKALAQISAQESPDVVGASYPNQLAEAASVALADGGTERAYLVYFPANDCLRVTALRAFGGGVEAVGTWDLETDLMTGDATDDWCDTKIAVDAVGAADGTLRVAYLDPWSPRLICWHLTAGPETPSRAEHALPLWWDHGQEARRYLTSIAGVAWDASLEDVHALVAVPGGETHLSTVNVQDGRWESRLLSYSTLLLPRLAVSPTQKVRVFYVHYNDRVIAEYAAGSSDITDLHEPNRGDGYVAVIGPDGRAHLVYRGYLGAGGERLLHWFESEDGWSREQIDHLEFADRAALDAEPVRTDMRPSACFDRNGAMHIAYFDYVHDVVKHATNEAGTWRIEPVASAKVVASTSIIATDRGIMLAFVDVWQGKVYVATRAVGAEGEG